MDTNLAQYGLAGICLIALAWFIMYLMKENKKEREETERQHRLERETWNAINQRQLEETNKNINRNTDILSELTTLLKSRK